MAVPIGILVEFDGMEMDSIHARFTGVQLLPMSMINIMDVLVSTQLQISCISSGHIQPPSPSSSAEASH